MSTPAVVEREPVEQLPMAPPVGSSPLMTMLSDAIQKGMSIDVIREIKAMAKEFEADDQRRQFDAAFASAKAEIEPIVRTRDGHNGKYADFAAVADAVDPILSKYGLSYRHRSVVAEGRITVICKLAHKGGYFEETELPAPPDKTGNKNEIQAIGSTLTYLQRYTLLLALGLSTAHDDNGRAAGGGLLTEDQVEELKGLIDKAVAARPGTNHADWIASFLEFMGAPGLNAIAAKDFGKAKSNIEYAIKQGGKK
jgi:hypothetical protein